jgi:hypothetical protein
MLFDLRGKRRRTVQITYAGLALLMGVGLVGAGIGSDASGGLFDAITGGGGGGSSQADKTIENRIDAAQKQIAVNPRNEGAYAVVVRSRYQLATARANQQGVFDEKGVEELEKAAATWTRYLGVAKKPDPSLAALMVQAYTGLAQSRENPQDQKPFLAGAADAAEVTATARPTVNGYLQLVQYAALAGQDRKATLAGEEAIDLAPKKQREEVKQQVAQAKAQAAQALQSQAQQQSPGAGGG